MRFKDTTGLMRWNRENRFPRGMAGVRHAITRHQSTIDKAERILEQEHGIKHTPGTHSLCPKCRAIHIQPQ